LQIAIAKQSLVRDTQREKFTKIFEMLLSLSLDFSRPLKGIYDMQTFGEFRAGATGNIEVSQL